MASKKTSKENTTIKKGTKPEKYTVEQFINALAATKGMKTLAARQVGCTYKTFLEYQRKYPEIAEAANDEREKMLDTVELKAYDRAMKDDTTMIIFLLKTQGKKRGYVERQEVTGAEGKAVEVTFVNDWRNPTSNAS